GAGRRRRSLQSAPAPRRRTARALPLRRRPPPLPGPMADGVRVILEELPRLPWAEDPAAAVERLAEAAKVGRQGARAWPDPAVYEQVKDAFKDFRDDLRGLRLERFTADGQGLPPAVEVGKRFLRGAAEAPHAYRERTRLHDGEDG